MFKSKIINCLIFTAFLLVQSHAENIELAKPIEIKSGDYIFKAGADSSFSVEKDGLTIVKSDSFLNHNGATRKEIYRLNPETMKMSRSKDGQDILLIYEDLADGIVKIVKTVRVKPEGIESEICYEPLSDEPIWAEYSVLLPGDVYSGWSFDCGAVRRGEKKGTLGQPSEKQGPISEGIISALRFQNSKTAVEFSPKNTGDTKWWALERRENIRNHAVTYALREARHGLTKGTKRTVGFSLSFPGAGAAAKKEEAPMAVGQIVEYTPVDISKVCNMGFTENDTADDGLGGWTDEGDGGNDFRGFPTGERKFCGIPFNIVIPGQNGGKSCVVLKSLVKKHFPESAVIDVGRKALSLYFLHTSAFSGEGEVCRYIVSYDDGEKESVPVVLGRDISDWWKPADLERCIAAWQGSNTRRAPIGISLFGWNNPHPEKTIKSVEIKSSMSKAVPILAGLTLSNRQYALIQERQREKITDQREWFEFTPPWDDIRDNATSVRCLLDAPAGKHGFLKTGNDGHLYFSNGKRAVFWGASLVSQAAVRQSRDEAEKVAACMAKRGINISRVHIIDRVTKTVLGERPQSLFDFSNKDTQHFSAENLDRFDYLISQLKKNGVYIMLDLLTYRVFTENDGVAVENFDKFGESEERSGVYFDPRTIELQKKYAKDLLTHLNPYTGLRYCDDPAVAMIQVVNEDTLFLYGYWKTLKGHYKTLFQEKWNIWLAQRYKNLENLRAAWGSLLEPGEDPASKSVKFSFPVGMTMGTWGGKSSARLDDQTLFCYDMEADFYKEMKNYLRDIGVKCPVIGSQALFLNLPDLKAQTVMDVIDQHPYSFGLRPVVKTNCWDYDTITQMAVTKVFGKPIITTEWNYHHLDIFEFRCDAPLFVAAYSRFQDWDCMNAHGYNHATGGRLKRIEWNQNIFNDPAFIGQWQAAANIFLRGDVTPAKEFVDIGRYYNNTFYKREMCRPIKGFLPYVKGARTKFFDRDSTPEDLEKDRLYFSESLNFKTGDILISDTGELEWHHSAGVLKINTAKTQAAIGFLKDFGEVRLENLAVKAKTDGAVSASLTSLDNLPLSGSKKMLLTIVGRAENTGMKWDSSRFICKNKGAGPVMMEGVEADISIASGSAGKIKARALDKYGDRTLDVPCSEKDGAARFSVSREYKTMYYEITAD